MENIIDTSIINLPIADTSIIKVIGVGGGGGNAVNHMYRKGISDVNFVVCNTDQQALKSSPVPTKIQLGEKKTLGLGAGGKPEIGKTAAEESIEEIKKMLDDNTKMVFITAGMGGGTGTGSSPVIAKAAYELGILTIGIVTIPFEFEGNRKIEQALEGVAALSEHVDAILVINNEKLTKIYPDFELSKAFAMADDVLANAAQGIAEIITVTGYINVDFADVNTIMKDGKVAIMNTGYAEGERRITKAIENALNSPLLNTNDVGGAGKVLLSLYCSREHQIKMEEVHEINEFMNKVGADVQVIWGASFDDDLKEQVKITIIATGYSVSDIPGMPISAINNMKAAKQVEPTVSTNNGPIILDDPKKIITNEQAANKAETANTEDTSAQLNIQGAKEQYYGSPDKKVEVGFEPEDDKIEEEQTIVSIEDLENEEKHKHIEEVPAWKRKRSFFQ